MFTALNTLLSRKNQRFVCFDTGWPTPGPEQHIAYICHEVGSPLDTHSIAQLREQVGDMSELLEFYKCYGTVRLYCDTIEQPYIGYASAFYIAPPETWTELKTYFEGWLDGLTEDEEDELIPEWLSNYAVIGEIPNSGNYFLVPLEGSERGKIYEFEHDGFEFIERVGNLADFLNSKSTVNDELLSEICGHTRYSDGKSDIQWLCKEYYYDQ